MTQTHPYLFLNSSGIDGLRRELQTNQNLSQHWFEMVDQADQLLKEECISEDYADASNSQHGNYGAPSNQIYKMADYLGLAYAITGDKKYGEKLKEALLYYSQYKKWFGKGCLDYDPPWHSELNTARFLYGFAVGYDYIYELLTESERRQIVDAVVRLGILPTLEDWLFPETRIHALDSMGHNWWSVCLSQAGLAALAIIHDHSEAGKWAVAISEVFPEWFNYQGNVLQNKSINFDRNGLFYEGINYANYGVSEYLIFRIAFQNVFGKEQAPEIPLLRKVGDALVNTCYPTSNGLAIIEFNDGHSDAGRCVKALLAAGFDDPCLRWYAAKSSHKMTPLDFIHYSQIFDGPAYRPAIRPNAGEFPDVGWAVFRSSWDDDATLVAIKSGFTWNHAHADAGSFVLFHKGKRLISDSRNCSYAREEYQSYFCQSHAHNVVLFNGQGQHGEDIYYGVKAPGKIHDFMQLGDCKYVYADATGPTLRHFLRNYRHLLWIGNVILIYDDLLTYEPGTIEWLLHYSEEISGSGKSLRIANGSSSATMVRLYPENQEVREADGLDDHKPDQIRKYLVFSPREQKREQKFITAVLIDEDAGTEVRLKEGETFLRVTIGDSAVETEIYFNLQADGRKMHRNSCNRLDNWETDAYILAVSRVKGADPQDYAKIKQILVSAGSFVRFNGEVVFDCLAKATCSFTLDEQAEVSIKGHVGYTARLNLGANARRIMVNGKTCCSTVDSQADLVEFVIPEQL